MQEYSYDALKLDSQLCFPLYACSRATIKLYTPLLETLDLTYTQYITMMVLWEKRSITVKELGKDLYLDSGTLTPLLKKLESKGLITRKRSEEDERSLIVTLTKEGESLRERAVKVPYEMEKRCVLNQEDRVTLYKLLHQMLKDYQPE